MHTTVTDRKSSRRNVSPREQNESSTSPFALLQILSKSTMQSGTGIQELMAAETRASQIVAEARIGECYGDRCLQTAIVKSI